MTAVMTPKTVVARIAAAIPEDCRGEVILVGSLAAGYHFFEDDGNRSIQTKDVDCMFSPHAKAVGAATQVAHRLLEANWKQKVDGDWGKPGDEHTPDDKLPLIRLKPPGEDGWFLEFLGAPDAGSDSPKTFYRVLVGNGHYAICSFNYLALAEVDPIETKYGVRIARPEMMALANLLHHPVISPEPINGGSDKRSNKDLGRVVALAWLTAERDRRTDSESLDAWPQRMAEALQAKFPGQARRLALQAGSGLRELLNSEADRAQALKICNRGLLASFDVGLDAFLATIRRLLQQVIEPLEELANGWEEGEAP